MTAQDSQTSNGDQIVDHNREEAARINARNAKLDERITKLEQQAAQVQARINEIDACFDLMKGQLLDYKATHTPEETQAKAKEVIAKYKEFAKTPGVACPVNKDRPISFFMGEKATKPGAVELHPEVKLAAAHTAGPLDSAALQAAKKSANLVRVA